jgi:hypothetical protein
MQKYSIILGFQGLDRLPYIRRLQRDDGEWYLAADADAKFKEYDDDNLALSESVTKLGARIAELEQLVEQLQKAVAFWLPHVPPEDTERAERISKDTFLLIGYEGPMVPGAEELGWVKLSELMER